MGIWLRIRTPLNACIYIVFPCLYARESSFLTRGGNVCTNVDMWSLTKYEVTLPVWYWAAILTEPSKDTFCIINHQLIVIWQDFIMLKHVNEKELTRYIEDTRNVQIGGRHHDWESCENAWHHEGKGHDGIWHHEG